MLWHLTAFVGLRRAAAACGGRRRRRRTPPFRPCIRDSSATLCQAPQRPLPVPGGLSQSSSALHTRPDAAGGAGELDGGAARRRTGRVAERSGRADHRRALAILLGSSRSAWRARWRCVRPGRAAAGRRAAGRPSETASRQRNDSLATAFATAAVPLASAARQLLLAAGRQLAHADRIDHHGRRRGGERRVDRRVDARLDLQRRHAGQRLPELDRTAGAS